MLASLFAGVSGLKNHQVRMNVIGNNIANINTIGFKGSRSIFQEALVSTLRGPGRPSSVSGGSNAVQLGLGMNVASVDNLFAQGGLEITNKITDLAIQGNGFFILSDGGREFYTRAGAFGFDANGYFVNPSNGLYVQGKMADNSGTIPATATIGNIRLPFGQQDPAQQTSSVSFGNNLNSSATRAEASPTAGTNATNGVTTVSGIARNGAGGEHIITVVGAQAQQSQLSGANIALPGVLTGNEQLGADLGVTDASGFTISVDGGSPIPITGLTLTSTVNDLLSAINNVNGVEAEIVAGEIQITRFKAGAAYTIETNTAVAGDIANRVFGTAVAATFNVSNGVDHTFAVTDDFTPSYEMTTITTSLGVGIDESSGLVTSITGLGGNGVTISTGITGLTAGTSSITTEDTEKATSITVYDKLGGKHVLMTNFTKSHEQNKWHWTVSMQGGEIIDSGATGTVRFNSDGSLLKFIGDGGNTKFVFDAMNGAGITEIDLWAGTGGEYDGITGFSGSETITALNQDGYGMGILDQIAIDPTGIIIGNFTNGVTRTLAQVVLADFNNKAGLMKSGGTKFVDSPNSGEAIRGLAGETISASINSGALEGANVDLAQEFTAMIIAQRGFQSNARVITTSDQLLEELVNIKR